MKKLLTAAMLATSIGAAQATPVMTRPTPTYNAGYHYGYQRGKDVAYNNVARTAVIVGAVVIATVVVYQLGKESRWTTNEKGVVYRF